jgi:lipopolysaccharide transport protein LptA
VKPQRLKQVQLGLLVMALAVGVAVVRTLRAPAQQPAGPPSLPSHGGKKGVMQTAGGEVIEFKLGQQHVKARFDSMTGSLQQEAQLKGNVAFDFAYVQQGQPSTGHVTADECELLAGLMKATFKGNVVVTTADGLEMKSPSFIYRGDKGLLKTEDRVDFKRKDISGSAVGLVYDANAGTADFQADAYLRVANDPEPPMEVHGGRAQLDKAQGELRFFDGVTSTRGSDSLRAKRMVLGFALDRRAINSLQAFDDVELIFSGASGAGVGLAGGAKGTGRREIRAPGLSVWFRPDRTMQEASAFFDAQMVLYPGPGEERAKRSIRANLLVFHFDDQGRLAEMQGQKNAVLRSEPLPPAKGDAQVLTCKNLVTRFRPASGEIEQAEARGDVDFVQGPRHATAEHGSYEGASSRLTLMGGPPTLEETGRSHLTAERIELISGTGDMTARGNARQTLLSSSGKGGFMAQKGQPTLLSADTIAHEAKARSTTYTGDALMRSGLDEVRGKILKLGEDAQGRQHLDVQEQVFSLLHPASNAGDKPAAPVEVRAGKMIYDQANSRVVYSGDAVLRQGAIVTRSPIATLFLGADGKSLDKLVAGEPVELTEGLRTAKGRQATYTPKDETIVVEGDSVSLLGPSQDIRGRALTFHVGDDRIHVDGREEGRTEAVFRKEPSKP